MTFIQPVHLTCPTCHVRGGSWCVEGKVNRAGLHESRIFAAVGANEYRGFLVENFDAIADLLIEHHRVTTRQVVTT